MTPGRIAAPLGAVLLCFVSAHAASLPQGWRLLDRDGLSIAAPADTTLESLGGIDAHGWRLRNSRLTISIQRGAFVADGDDSEPGRCYDESTIVVDGRRTVLRTGKGFPRLDCPEKYASFFIAAEPPAGKAIYVWGRGESRDDLAEFRAVVATIHFQP